MFHHNEERVRGLIPGAMRGRVFGGLGAVWPKADWRAASLAEGRLTRGLVDSRLMDFEFRDIQMPTDKVSFDVARLRVYRKSEVIVS